jgi:CelD/BcsL family acetyltransferase involved in cellulose biosynthesis
MADAPARLLITSENLDALAPEWAALHGSIPGRVPFTHPEWHRLWLRHFGQSTMPVFLSLRQGEGLVGVMALDMERDVARQLGDPNVCDYAGLLALPGREGECAEGIIEWLMEDYTFALEVWGVARDELQRTAFEVAAARFGWSSVEAEEAVCPVAALPADWDSYLASLSKHDRHELRRKLRRLAAAGSIEFDSVTEPGQVAAGMDAFLAFMRMSRDDKDEFLTPAMEAFFRDIATSFAALGMARLSSLSIDGQAVAMLFAFEKETTEYLYNSGYDPAYAHLAVGLLSKANAVQAAISRGRQSFDFLRGEEEYKRHLGGVPRQLLKLRLQQA